MVHYAEHTGANRDTAYKVFWAFLIYILVNTACFCNSKQLHLTPILHHCHQSLNYMTLSQLYNTPLNYITLSQLYNTLSTI